MITFYKYVKRLVEKFMHCQEYHRIWIFQKDVFLGMRSLNNNLAIVPLYGYVIVMVTMAQ